MTMALREAMLQSLSCMLSSHTEIRKLAEDRMKALEVTDEYTDLLLEIVLTTDEALEERQLAAIILKQFIKEHWTEDDLCDDIIISDDAKHRIRFLLPMGLSDVQPKIRTAVAVTLSYIAEHDYPERWPNMTHVIKTKLLTNNVNEVDGVITFLDSCSRLFYYDNLFLLTKEVFDIFHNILESEMFTPNIKARVIKAMSHLLLLDDNNLGMSVPEYPIELISRFYTLVCRQLQKPCNNSMELRSVLIRVLNQLLHKYMGCVHNSLKLLLPTIWELLSRCGNEYRLIIMNADQSVNGNIDEEKVHFEHLISNIFSLIYTIVLSDHIASSFSEYFPELIYWIILFQSIIPSFERDWEQDEYNFLNDDYEDRVCNSIRTTLRNLLNTIINNLDSKQTKHSISYAMKKHVEEAEFYKQHYYVYWWRILESIMFSLGNISWVIKEKHYDCFDTISEFLSGWTHLLDSQAPMILQARIIWVGGQYSAHLTFPCFVKHINNIIQNITASHHIVRISAIRALSFHCLNIRQETLHFDFFLNASEDLFERLLSVSQHSNSIFGACVDCIRFILKINPSCATRHSSRLSQFLTEHVIKNLNDTYTVEKSLEVIKDLSNNHFIVATLQQTLLQVFLNILINPSVKSEENDSRCLALRIINFLIVYSPKHLVQDIVQQSFPVVYTTTVGATETALLELGIMCIQTFLAKATEHVCRLRDIGGQSGIDCIQVLLKQVLSPTEVELTSILVAKFVIFALRAIQQYKLNILDMTIRGLVSKIHIFSIMHYEDSLVLVFAYLFYTNMEYTSLALNIIPGPEGGSALKYIFIKWLKKHHCFYGKLEKNLSTVSLAKVMEYALSRNDERLISITVSNDIIPRPATNLPPIPTDNRPTADHEPLFIKIFRLLLKIVTYEITARQEKSLIERDTTTDEVLEAIIEPENDLEYIYKIDLIDYLVDLLRQFSRTHHYENVLNFMKPEDKNDLASVI